jgi:hypothetical protein
MPRSSGTLAHCVSLSLTHCVSLTLSLTVSLSLSLSHSLSLSLSLSQAKAHDLRTEYVMGKLDEAKVRERAVSTDAPPPPAAGAVETQHVHITNNLMHLYSLAEPSKVRGAPSLLFPHPPTSHGRDVT